MTYSMRKPVEQLLVAFEQLAGTVSEVIVGSNKIDRGRERLSDGVHARPTNTRDTVRPIGKLFR
jgi:hypothetical protein